MDASTECPTIVSKSPQAADEEKSTANHGIIGFCSKRAAGQVCICTSCEAARTRLLDRRNEKDLTTVDAVSGATTASPTKRKRSSIDDTDGDTTDQAFDNKLRVMSEACTTIIESIGEDPNREGLRKTPERWSKALLFMCQGYHRSAIDVTNNAIFQENHNEMVVVRNIDIHSLCEHHMLPFSGRIHIGYIPNGKLLGLSKFARIAEVFARRLQVQERLTRQIADAILETVEPLGVAVVIECTHFCVSPSQFELVNCPAHNSDFAFAQMVMRGVQKPGAVTTTSSVRGCFESNLKTRAEFFSILHGGAKSC